MTSESRAALQAAQTIASECVGARVRMLNRAATRIYDDLLRPHGIKFSQMNILTVITLRGPIQSVEVARMLCFEKSTLSRNIKLLEENGWIESVRGETGNLRLLRATRLGRRLLTRAAPAWQEAQDRLTALLGKRTASAVREGADRLRKSELR